MRKVGVDIQGHLCPLCERQLYEVVERNEHSDGSVTGVLLWMCECDWWYYPTDDWEEEVTAVCQWRKMR